MRPKRKRDSSTLRRSCARRGTGSHRGRGREGIVVDVPPHPMGKAGGLGRLAPKLKAAKPPPPPTLASRLLTTPPTWLLALCYALCYLAFSSSIILANKHIITETNFNCPITVASLGSAFGWAVALAGVGSGWVKLKTHLTLTQWTLLVLPIGVCTALSLAFANIAYFYLSLSFIQMVKAFAPVFTFVVLVAFGLDAFDVNLALAIAVIVAGCFTAAYGAIHATSAQLGILCMLVCELSEAFRTAGMQYLLAARSFSLFDGLYYFSPATLGFLVILVYVFEWESLRDAAHAAAIADHPLLFLCASTLGFLVNLSSLGVIQTAGSLTLKLVGQLKNVVVILAAVALYGDEVTALEVAGYLVATLGFAMYQEARWRAGEFRREEEGLRQRRVYPASARGAREGGGATSGENGGGGGGGGGGGHWTAGDGGRGSDRRGGGLKDGGARGATEPLLSGSTRL